MIKKPLLLAILFLTAMIAGAQPVKYKDPVFEGVRKTEDLSYDQSGDVKNKAHLFDLFQPAGDGSINRPLIIWMHGGGFKFGSKNDKNIRLWSRTFAQRGYVCAAINYTHSKKLPFLHFDELKRACYYATLDARQAVAYFRQHAAEYHIDPDKIILGGNSAGGIMALQAAYSTDAELAKFAGIIDEYSHDQDLVKVSAIINFWGGIFNRDWLKNAHVPIVNVYGSTDNIVPPTHKDAPLYGAEDIHQKADKLSIPNKLKVFEGYSHELRKHFDPVTPAGRGTRSRWLEAGQFAADFLYEEVFKGSDK